MNRVDFENKSFDELCEELCSEHNEVHSYEDLKDYAISEIQQDNLFLAVHILKHIDDGTDYYLYDISMGTLESPSELWDKEDLIGYDLVDIED